jgi:hypothetical protein
MTLAAGDVGNVAEHRNMAQSLTARFLTILTRMTLMAATGAR